MASIDTVAATTMRVVCGKDELAEKLQVVGRGVSTRTTVQILAGIMLRAAGGRLHLSATDMEISLRVSLEAQVDEEGAIVVPGRLLVDIVRLLPAGEVTLEHRADEGVARLTLRLRVLLAEHLRARGLPAAPGDRPGERVRRRARGVPRHDRARRPLRVARRVAAGADRDPRPLRGRQARDGGDRLLPPERQGDAALAAARAASWRRSCPPARSRSSRASARRPRARRSRSACRRTRSSSASTASG